jgi:hypothetical protein
VLWQLAFSFSSSFKKKSDILTGVGTLSQCASSHITSETLVFNITVASIVRFSSYLFPSVSITSARASYVTRILSS